MKSKRDLQERDIIDLLKRWKATEPTYPRDLKEKRRNQFLTVIAGLPVLASLHPPVKGSLPHTGAAGADLPMTITMKIVLGVMATTIMALSVYAGNIIQDNWDEIVAYLQGGPVPTLSITLPHPTASILNQPTAAATATPIPTGTVSVTPMPSSTNVSVSATEVGSTPVPPTSNPGNHYGQTKTPRPKPTKRP